MSGEDLGLREYLVHHRGLEQILHIGYFNSCDVGGSVMVAVLG
jgi:hypothetical protein